LSAEVQHTTYKINISEEKTNNIKTDQASVNINHLSEVNDQQRDIEKNQVKLIQRFPLHSPEK
jgi:hypothetical protein